MIRGDGVARGTGQLTRKKLKADNVAPARISRKRLEKDYLCMGAYSPCHRCEVQCHYGRLYQEIKAKGTKKDE